MVAAIAAVWAEACLSGECFLMGPTGTQSGSITWGPKHVVKPRGSAEHLQELPTTSDSLHACPAAVVGCWCFSFDSSPGLGQSPSVTHTYWLLADFGLFSSETFFSSMNFLLFFQIQSTDEIAVLLSQSFLDLFKVRSQLFKSKQGEFIKSLCVHRGWLHWCKWNPQTIQSLAC